MKRGYMDWKQELLPLEQLKKRQAEFVKNFDTLNIDAAVVYGSVGSADELQYLTNFGPYFFFVAAVIFKDGRLFFVSGLSGRVNPWISKLTGLDNSRIIAAGPKFNSKVAELLQEQLGSTGVVGLTGRYLPQELAAAVEGAGFKTVFYQDPIDEQLANRDEAYLKTIKEGIGLMLPAIEKVLKDSEIESFTRQRVATEVEYACRKAGAMDILILTGNEGLVFDQPHQILDNDKPWTLYVQVQYLGEWIVIARNMNKGYGQAARAALDKAAAKLVPGQHNLAWEEDGYSFTIHTRILSDHLSSQIPAAATLKEGQVISLSVADMSKGIYLQDMYQVGFNGGEILTAI